MLNTELEKKLDEVFNELNKRYYLNDTKSIQEWVSLLRLLIVVLEKLETKLSKDAEEIRYKLNLILKNDFPDLDNQERQKLKNTAKWELSRISSNKLTLLANSLSYASKRYASHNELLKAFQKELPKLIEIVRLGKKDLFFYNVIRILQFNAPENKAVSIAPELAEIVKPEYDINTFRSLAYIFLSNFVNKRADKDTGNQLDEFSYGVTDTVSEDQEVSSLTDEEN